MPAGGLGTYSYTWKESTDGSSFSSATGINDNIDYSPGNLVDTTYYKREVTSGVCNDISGAVDIYVLPQLGNNLITAN